MPEPTIRVALTIADFEEDPEIVSKVLALSPSKTWRKEEPLSAGTRTHAENGWVFEIAPKQSLDAEHMIVALLDRIPPSYELLPEALKRYTAEIACIITINDQAPALNFSSQTLRRLSIWNMTLDIDIYLSE